jgi:8-oxo-dGTP pyrophosphatase MutT (NUDIX family)
MSTDKITIVAPRLVYENPFVLIFDDDVTFPGGNLGRYLRICWRPGFCVAVVPITADGHVILVRQFCYAVQKVITQIPKGFGKPGLSPQETAELELHEEAGASAETLEQLVTFYEEPDIFQTPLHVFLARGASITSDRHTEVSEVINDVVLVNLARFESISMLEVTADPVSLAAIDIARKYLGR